LAQRHADDFGDVVGTAARTLLNLPPTAEPVGGQQCVGGGTAHRRQQHALAARRRDVVFAALEAEGAGHAAAAGIEDVKVETEALEQGVFGGKADDRLVMAMSVHDGAAG
jgi:hypothetical protein